MTEESYDCDTQVHGVWPLVAGQGMGMVVGGLMSASDGSSMKFSGSAIGEVWFDMHMA